jgi:FkbM family methyltransferase
MVHAVNDSPLEMPPGTVLAPMQDWNHYYGVAGDDPGWRERFERAASLPAPTPMRWLFDLELMIQPGDQISQAVYISGLYEPCTADALRRLLAPGDTFVDVGANVGLLSLLASRWVGPSGRVVCLEPSAREFARLREHVERNRLVNVVTFQVAAGAEPGSAVLHVAEARYPGLNTLEPSFMYTGVAEDHAEQVPVVRLDDFLAAQGIDVVSTMKIDVEGFEPQVVAGAQRTIARDRPVLLIEVVGPALEPSHEGRRGIERFLLECGYAFAAIDGHTARIDRVKDLAYPAENMLAARPEVLARVLTNP